jgi:hypothetical protein
MKTVFDSIDVLNKKNQEHLAWGNQSLRQSNGKRDLWGRSELMG